MKRVIVLAVAAALAAFALSGLGQAATPKLVGTKTWTVKLKKGKYTYQCDIHAASGMKGSFKVT